MNNTSNYKLEETVKFSLEGMMIMGRSNNSEIKIILNPGQKERIDLRITDP